MDKGVQANAANSEESAFASEELSAQAGQLNDMVAELSAVVGGSRDSDGNMSSERATTPRRRMPVGSGGGSGLQDRVSSMLHRVQEVGARVVDNSPTVKPEEQIPLNNKDFKDF